MTSRGLEEVIAALGRQVQLWGENIIEIAFSSSNNDNLHRGFAAVPL
jgi:hypothetical protein